jgi:adrenodoxin-NADP+ reductase
VDAGSVPEEVERGLKDGTVVTYEDWRRVDEEERRRGELAGKERERMRWAEVRAFLGRGQDAGVKMGNTN